MNTATTETTPTATKPKESLWETLITIIYAVAVAVLIRTFLFEPFNIPSASMVPTLLVGDYLFVSKYSYGYSKHSFPFSAAPFHGRIFGSEPKRGDVIVFKVPTDNKTDYIKRLIGLPGDTIRMENGRLYINGQMVEREKVDMYADPDDGGIIEQTRYRETLPGGKVHYILEDTDNGPYDNTPEFHVPAGHFFMMGDNRDHSLDSRAEVGYVPAENLVGRAEFRFFSTNGYAHIWQVWRWPFSIRYNRLLTGIN
ncbi:MAG: signal peptidase I [Vulcanimicrobiaceae bacterium]